VDLRRLTSVDAGGFERIREYLVEHGRLHNRLVERQVLLRPTGFMGAVVTGFYGVNEAPYPTRVVATPAEAAAWLGRPEVAHLLDELDLEVRRLIGGPTRTALRALLLDELSLSLAVAAKRLGLSERTLQRRLDEERTSWKEEVRAARIERAKSLLVDTDVKIGAVAAEVGCASAQSFSALFRRMTGQTPGEFRASSRK
jgi:AraC-like DNA-binding protein